MNAHCKSAATDPHKPLPLWLTSPQSRPALHVPIWARLLRALSGPKKQEAVQYPIPWHSHFTDTSQGAALPGEDVPEPKND
jgi:hypothetical protein